ncbi:hypothetical protein [Kribbella caucasensis]|uniref:hypothetical protein n=1 Tax=Kribbella caucasensis TaxID=2512215 RepID=UPI00105D48C1|nr:hypothetical protein [Kribbella sp. VKM Ac-2527]
MGVLVLVAGLMAWDHLWGNEGSGEFPVDAGTFVIAMAVSLVCGGLINWVVVPRTIVDLSKAPRRALWLSGLAVPLVFVAGWLGFPLVIAGGGIVLGLLSPSTPGRNRMALGAIVLGLLVLGFGVVATAFPPTDS